MSALFDQLVAVSAEDNGVTERDSGYDRGGGGHAICHRHHG